MYGYPYGDARYRVEAGGVLRRFLRNILMHTSVHRYIFAICTYDEPFYVIYFLNGTYARKERKEEGRRRGGGEKRGVRIIKRERYWMTVVFVMHDGR